jgi:uncharacterized damage-inducible protein DinB
LDKTIPSRISSSKKMNNTQTLTRYKAWANEIIFTTVASLPEGEAVKKRLTRYKNMVHTLNHVYVIDLVFQAHLEGRQHGFTARNTVTHPPLAELWEAVKITDQWYINLSDKLSAEQLKEVVNFDFIGGGKGSMTREEIILHIVNHGTYHRGLVADMMYQVPLVPPSTDLPVFLRDRGK